MRATLEAHLDTYARAQDDLRITQPGMAAALKLVTLANGSLGQLVSRLPDATVR